jgi:TonB family protein
MFAIFASAIPTGAAVTSMLLFAMQSLTALQPEFAAVQDPTASNSPSMSIVRTPPICPTLAANRGLDAFVVVQFDVLSDGTVANISVLNSSSSVFERAAIQAANRFRFKAREIDGVPQTSTGVQYQFTFKMDN